MSDSIAVDYIPVQLIQNLAVAFLDQYGPEGFGIVKKAVCRFGHTQGKLIRQKVEDMGLETGLDNFLRYGGFCKQNYSPTGKHPGVGINGMSYEIRHCPLEDQVEDAHKVEVSLILCELDRALLCGYNPELVTTHSGCLRLGSDSCRFVSKVHSA